jgi:DNA-binding XRE family transcriptional regulator
LAKQQKCCILIKGKEGGMTMSKFFDETMQGLLEAVEIEKGDIPLVSRNDMPATTLVVSEKEGALIDAVVRIRKELNMSQSELASLTGNKQQAISRFEKKEHSPSLKLFYSIVDALGCELQIVKKV